MGILELKLLKGRKWIIPLVALSLILFLVALIDYYIGVGKKYSGDELAAYVALQAFHSSVLILFFLMWMLQYSSHLFLSGYYKMLLMLGWSRDRLFLYLLFQLVWYVVLFMLLNFVVYTVLGVFYGLAPWKLLLHTDINAMISLFACLFLVGCLGVLFTMWHPGYIMALPVLIYWMFEGWLGAYLNRVLEVSWGNYFPLKAMRQLIGDKLLDTPALISLCGYAVLILVFLSVRIQRRMFV